VRIDLGKVRGQSGGKRGAGEALARAGFSASAEVARLLLELRQTSALVRKLA